MSKLIDLAGQKFGRLSVVSKSDNLHNKTAWNCLCNCGNFKIVTSSDLKCGKVKSCGCYRVETTRETARRNAKSFSHKRLRSIHYSMISRCYNKNNIAYKNYGGRGISVCDEWRGKNGLGSFIEWAYKNGYEDDLTIDRVNTNKDYRPYNCRWSTMKEQQNNRRNNVVVNYGGSNYTLSELSETLGLSHEALAWRLNAGWPERDLSLQANLNNKNIRRACGE